MLNKNIGHLHHKRCVHWKENFSLTLQHLLKKEILKTAKCPLSCTKWSTPKTWITKWTAARPPLHPTLKREKKREKKSWITLQRFQLNLARISSLGSLGPRVCIKEAAVQSVLLYTLPRYKTWYHGEYKLLETRYVTAQWSYSHGGSL